MIELRWLTRSWEEFSEFGSAPKSEKVLQYRARTQESRIATSGIAGINTVTESKYTEWKDVPEEFEDV